MTQPFTQSRLRWEQSIAPGHRVIEPMSLVVISTHPIQYHTPVYRAVQRDYGIPVTVVYGSDFSVAGYRDREFGTRFAWDTDLLSGYRPVFLSQVEKGGAKSPEEISVRGLGQALREAAPTAVLLPGYSPLFYQFAFWHAQRAGVPLLFRGEATDHALSRSPLKQWVRDHSLRWFYGRFSKLLFIGQRSLEHYRRLGGSAGQLVFSPYCVDTGPFQSSECDRDQLRSPVRHQLDLPPEQYVILFAGKLVPRKGPDLLLHAAKKLSADLRRRLVMLFLGDGPLRESLQQLAQLPPSIDVRFVGFQNQQFLSRYYHAADVLVLPSHHSETWGLVINEALHHGLPCVVSSNVGCAPDLIEPGITGEIFDSGDMGSLTSTLERALSLVNRPEVRAQCRAKVNGYTVENAAGGIAQAYQDVMGK